MTIVPDEITPRQLAAELIKAARSSINVRPGRTHTELIVDWAVPVYEIRLSFIATPSPTGSTTP